MQNTYDQNFVIGIPMQKARVTGAPRPVYPSAAYVVAAVGAEWVEAKAKNGVNFNVRTKSIEPGYENLELGLNNGIFGIFISNNVLRAGFREVAGMSKDDLTNLEMATNSAYTLGLSLGYSHEQLTGAAAVPLSVQFVINAPNRVTIECPFKGNPQFFVFNNHKLEESKNFRTGEKKIVNGKAWQHLKQEIKAIPLAHYQRGPKPHKDLVSEAQKLIALQIASGHDDEDDEEETTTTAAQSTGGFVTPPAPAPVASFNQAAQPPAAVPPATPPQTAVPPVPGWPAAPTTPPGAPAGFSTFPTNGAAGRGMGDMMPPNTQPRA